MYRCRARQHKLHKFKSFKVKRKLGQAVREDSLPFFVSWPSVGWSPLRFPSPFGRVVASSAGDIGASPLPAAPSVHPVAVFGGIFALNPPKTALFLSARYPSLVRILQANSKLKFTRI